MEPDFDAEETRRLLRTLGMRPSRSAEAARARQIAEICALSVEDRILLALRLGRRDRALQQDEARAAETPPPETIAGRGPNR